MKAWLSRLWAKIRRLARQFRPALIMSLAPAAWFAHLNISYALIPHACRWELPSLIYLTTAVTLAISLVALVAGWKTLPRRGRMATNGDDARGPVLARRGEEAVVAVGAMFALLFGLVIIMGGVSPLFVGICR